MTRTTGESPPTWLDQWVAERNAELRTARLEREAEDPGVPLQYGTATGVPTFHPWSAVAGARVRLPRVFNLDKLHRRVLELMGQKPL